MLYGSALHSAHRAPSEAGLALLVRQGLGHESSPIGQHRQPPAQRRARREPQRTMQMLTSGLAAVIMLAICGLTGFFIIADERRGHDADASGRTTGGLTAISSRAVDAVPLSLEEVFPASRIRLVPGSAPYRLQTMHIDHDCAFAAVGALGPVLRDHACNQVVSAGMTAPYGGYQVTAGIFNLADEDDAAQVGAQARQLVEAGDGTFAALAGSLGGDPLNRPPAQVGWHERGHFLIYCVIARPDGHVVRDDDPYAQQITLDLVETYLGEQIVDRRSSLG
jgi:hypothetical protein